ncbi:hypothetical protein ILUMI_08992 [Ignelater luminosus]|uniref:Protein yellow n=1 Tax=Ignelater luminosus TaxID=2038154 RepID=A0A8K0GFH1_IGNLU|nr:hypothetical protein ILUMI_08992 [Ignelater luminosus]
MSKLLPNLLLTILIISLEKTSAHQKFREYYHWNLLDYAFPSLEEKLNAILTRKFIPENNLPVGIEVWGDKIFITVPRWREGIPSTLNYVTINDFVQESFKSPLLIPYPDLKSNEAGNCRDGLTTVYRIKADQCNRLWVLDTGTFGIESTTQNLCPYTLKIFDLKTDRIIRKYELHPEDIRETTFIANIAVDIGRNCEDAYAYMSDELGYGLIVYSWEHHKSWRFSHPFFNPDPVAGNFTIDGFNFQWDTEGIFSMVLSLPQGDGHKILFFNPLASYREFAVSTKILRDETKVNNSYNDFIALNERGKNSHITAKVMDEYGVEFFTLIDINAIGCWYSGYPYATNFFKVLHRDDKNLIFPSDLKIDRKRNLWVISDRMSNFLYRGLNPTEVNFRILFAPINDLIQNTVCGIY